MTGRAIARRAAGWLAVLLAGLVLAACSGEAAQGPTASPAETTGESAAPASDQLTDVTLMLDWVPNTNHTGLFVAQEEGYFEDEGLNVDIIQPGEVLAEQAVIGGQADFGVSFQEQVTLSRAQAGTPLVSIAAIMQHNTSGFASRGALNVEGPADWEGLTYGAFGSPFEEPTLQSLMECDGGDFSQLTITDVGFADPLALLQEDQVDLAWIFYGWQGFQAQQQGVDIDIVMMSDWFDCIPDYYTPLLVASEDTVANRPEVVRAFLSAVARGYESAIDNPDEAATILLDAAPELDEATVRASQAWVSPRYAADAPQWGYQDAARWADYAQWMIDNGIIEGPFDTGAAFTAEFLPER
jgi:ABC-type nitrate/sulfonate/bicarbonate transport system substrate-binding protein